MEGSTYSAARDREYDYINPAALDDEQVKETVAGYLTFSPGGPGPKSESPAASVHDYETTDPGYETPRTQDSEYETLNERPPSTVLNYQSLQLSEERNTKAKCSKGKPAKFALAVAVAVVFAGAGVGIGWYFSTNHNIDVNECTNGEAVCPFRSECVDLEKGYTCQCEPGYLFRPGYISCEDINECDPQSKSPAKCDSSCVNTVGSFECVCLPGYELNNYTNRCEAVKKCTNGQGSCTIGIECLVPHEGYTCQCKPGYGPFQCVCLPGYELNRNTNKCEVMD